MIYLAARDLGLPHTGMWTYAAGLREAAPDLLTVVDVADLERLRFTGEDLVIFDEYVGLDGGAELARHSGHRGPRWGVLWHSPLLQLDLCGLLQKEIWLRRDRGDGKQLDAVICADRQLARLLGGIWLPHCVPAIPDRLPDLRRDLRPDPRRRSRCWMPMTLPDDDPYYRHKNTHCQVAAVHLVQARTHLPFEVSVNFASPLLKDFADLLSVPLNEIGSLPAAELDAFVANVDVGLCVSLAESFCYSAAELMLAGVPVLFGPAIGWAWRSVELREICGVASPGAPDEIADRLQALFTDQDAYHHARRVAFETASRTLAHHRATVRGVLEELATA